ncbi:toprim domain-containing protein, partial [Escherichia coli]
TGAVTGAQLIAPTGEKSILPGSTMKGAFVSLSPLPSEPPVQVVITEGYATALTVSQLTAGCVVAAISAGNLPNVAQSLRARWPEVKIIIAGDNDFQDGGENPGRAFAERAAKAVGGWMTLPPGEIKADWNDFHREHGITRAREAFRNGLVLCGEGRTQLPHGFRLTQEYLWYEKQVQRNGETEIQNVKICSPLR